MNKVLALSGRSITLPDDLLAEVKIDKDRAVYFEDINSNIRITTSPIKNEYGACLLNLKGQLILPRSIIQRLDGNTVLLDYSESTGLFILLPVPKDGLDYFIEQCKKSDNNFPVLLLDPEDQFSELEEELRKRTRFLDHVVRVKSTDGYGSREFYSTVSTETLSAMSFTKRVYPEVPESDEVKQRKILQSIKRDIISGSIVSIEIRNGHSLKNSINEIVTSGMVEDILVMKVKCIESGEVQTIAIEPTTIEELEVSLFGYKVVRDEILLFHKYNESEIKKELKEFYNS